MPTALVFGASRGLGKAIAVELAGRGWRVIGTVRTAGALADVASDTLTEAVLDTTDRAAVDALREKLAGAGTALDLVYVSAAIVEPKEPWGEIDPAAFDRLMRVNVLAPLAIVDTYADLVTAEGTVAVMSSGLGSIALNDSGGYEAYRSSKAALDQGLRSIFARRRDKRTWLAVDPGWVKTDMGGPDANLTIDQSIPPLVDMLEARAGAGGVAFVSYANEELPW